MPVFKAYRHIFAVAFIIFLHFVMNTFASNAFYSFHMHTYFQQSKSFTNWGWFVGGWLPVWVGMAYWLFDVLCFYFIAQLLFLVFFVQTYGSKATLYSYIVMNHEVKCIKNKKQSASRFARNCRYNDI